MKINKHLLSFSFLVACAAVVLLAFPASTAGGEANAEEAKAMFMETYKCVRCHSIASVGIENTSEKMKSTDLGAYATDDPESLARFLRKEENRGDTKHKKTFDGSDEDLAKILAWVGSLEAAPQEEG